MSESKKCRKTLLRPPPGPDFCVDYESGVEISCLHVKNMIFDDFLFKNRRFENFEGVDLKRCPDMFARPEIREEYEKHKGNIGEILRNIRETCVYRHLGGQFVNHCLASWACK